MPACRNLKIYSTSKETPKLHLPKDRRYFSGVRDLAFGFHSDLILLLENPMEQVLSERKEAHQKLCRTDIDFDSQVSYQLKISTHSKPRSYQSQNCYWEVLSKREEVHQKLCRTDKYPDSQVSYQLKKFTRSKPRSYQSEDFFWSTRCCLVCKKCCCIAFSGLLLIEIIAVSFYACLVYQFGLKFCQKHSGEHSVLVDQMYCSRNVWSLLIAFLNLNLSLNFWVMCV